MPTVDRFLSHLGDPGRYQVIIMILMAANCIPVVVNHLLMAFYVPFKRTSHNCRVGSTYCLHTYVGWVVWFTVLIYKIGWTKPSWVKKRIPLPYPGRKLYSRKNNTFTRENFSLSLIFWNVYPHYAWQTTVLMTTESEKFSHDKFWSSSNPFRGKVRG